VKRLFAGLALVVVAALITLTIVIIRDTPAAGSGDAAAAQAGVPEISLRLNGFAPGTKPFVLTQGEPLLVEFQLRHPDRHAKEPILLEPPTGSWAERAKILVTDGRGTPSAWRFVVTGKPSPGGLALQPAAVSTLVLRMEEGARAAIIPGSYRLIARLDLEDSRGFRGTVDSEAASVNVVAAPASPVGMALGRRQLLRVRDALLRGDVAAAEVAATEMQRAEPRRPEGFIGMALVEEAKGQRSRAIQSVELAISRVSGGDPDEVARGGSKANPGGRIEPKQPPKAVPVEYFELLRRIERLPPVNPPKR